MGEHLQNLTELESEFMGEQRGEGSLSPFIAEDAANFSKGSLRDGEQYAGFDIHIQDLEALYFEGLKLPRWESIPGDDLAEKQATYRKSLAERTADYPLISRVTDTDQKVRYTPDEVVRLGLECEAVLNDTDHPKAVRALQKIYIVCQKAAAHQMALVLIPTM